MSRRYQIGVFAVLLVILGVVVYANLGGGPELSSVLFANEKFEPLGVPDPALRLDLVERLRKLEYKGPKRNIFSAALAPAPAAEAPPEQPRAEQPSAPPAPPQLQVPVRFYGYVTESGGGRRRACFTDGDEIYILHEGAILLGRFRLLRIGPESADFEEIATGRRATLQLEQPPNP